MAGLFWSKQFLNADGTVVAGVKVSHYAAGTTTLKNVFIDANKTTVDSQPSIGDSRGRVWFYGDGNYRLVITDADGIDLYDFNDVQINDITTTTFTNSGLQIDDTDASHVAKIKIGSDFTADRTITITPGDSDGDIALLGVAQTWTAAQIFNGAVTINENSADVNFRVEGANNVNLIVLDAGQDALSFGGANVDGAAFAFNNLQKRTFITLVGSQIHVPAQTTNFDNVSETIAVGAGAFFGIPTYTGDNATLTITALSTIYIQGVPVDGNNVTGVDKYSLHIEAGLLRADGGIIGDKAGNLALQADDTMTFGIDQTNDDTGLTFKWVHNGGGTELMRLTDAGLFLVGDTANANMTIGLTINQAGNDDNIVDLKSSDVTHTFTDIVEADTYGAFKKIVNATGGLRIFGFSSDATNGIAVRIQGFIPDGGIDDTSTTAGTGVIAIDANVDDDSTGSESFSIATVTGNLFVVRDAALTQFIVKEDGEILSNIAAAVYDDYKHGDTDLVRAFSLTTSPRKIIKDKWDQFIKSNEQDLIDMGILGAPLNQHPLYSVTNLQMLHNGAISQLAKQNMELREEIAEVKRLALENHGTGNS